MPRWVGGTFILDAGEITDDKIDASASISATKLTHRYKAGTNFNLAIGGTPAAREEIVYVAKSSAVLSSFHALLNDTGTSTDVDFDLKVNGASVLNAVVNITHADGDGAVKDGTLSSTSLEADDIVSISLAVTSSTGSQGPFAWAEINEVAT